MKYRLFKKGAFEGLDKFETRLNQETDLGWRVINIVPIGGSIVALLEKLGTERFH